MFMVDEASLRMFSSVSKDERGESEPEEAHRATGKPDSPANARLNFSDEDSNSEKFDYVSMRQKHFATINPPRSHRVQNEENYAEQLNRSDFFVQKDYKGIRGRRSTLHQASYKTQYRSSRTSIMCRRRHPAVA